MQENKFQLPRDNHAFRRGGGGPQSKYLFLQQTTGKK